MFQDYLGDFIRRMGGSRHADARLLFVGLDACGRTTTLYMLKLGEVITTIPTIGFNVETVDIRHPRTRARVPVTAWDVGGCDKIRPLWRHYFVNTQGLVFFVDANDHDRMPEARDELCRLLNEDQLRAVPVLVLANKQDLPGAWSADKVAEVMELHQAKGRLIKCMPSCAVANEGLTEAFEWLLEAIDQSRPLLKTAAEELNRETVKKGPKKSEEESLLEKWINVVDEPDDDFIKALETYTLDNWDHRTHLRLAWLFLTRHGRREGMERIFSGIKNFIENSPRTKRAGGRGTTFHATLTYTWTHLVHFAIVSASSKPADTFKSFLMLNPQLTNGGLPLHYYSKKLLFDTAETRAKVVLPDKRPLPSITSNMAVLKANAALKSAAERQQAIPEPAPASDTATFLLAARDRLLPGWGHDSMLRVIWECLRLHGVSEGQERALALLAKVQGEGFHFTMAHFWCQVMRRMMVHDHAPAMERLRAAAVVRSRQHKAEQQAVAAAAAAQQREEGERRQRQADGEDAQWAVDLLNSLLATQATSTTSTTTATTAANASPAATSTTAAAASSSGAAPAAASAEADAAGHAAAADSSAPQQLPPPPPPQNDDPQGKQQTQQQASRLAQHLSQESEWVVVAQPGVDRPTSDDDSIAHLSPPPQQAGADGPPQPSPQHPATTTTTATTGPPSLADSAHSMAQQQRHLLSVAKPLAAPPASSPHVLTATAKDSTGASPGASVAPAAAPAAAAVGKTALLASTVAAEPGGGWLLGATLTSSALPEASEGIPTWPALLAQPGYSSEAAKKLVLDRNHWERHYSRKVMMGDEAQRTLVLPDKKPLSSIV